MSKWIDKKKLILLLVVCAAHAAVLWIFGARQGGIETSQKAGPAIYSFEIPPSKSNLINDIAERLLTQPVSQIGTATDTKPYPPAAATKPVTAQHESSDWLGLKSPAYFLDAQAIDKTADPLAGFETALAERLPLNIESVVLEFWIENDGSTVLIRCVEGDCNETVQASLAKLVELRFNPALKEGVAVPSRKVIQIDPKPVFGM